MREPALGRAASLTVLHLREASAGRPLTAREQLHELPHDGDEGLLNYDAITPIKPHLGEGYDRVVRRLRSAIEPHPDSAKPVIETLVPEWDEVTRLVRQAAPVFAGIRTQSWDVALTNRGPVFLEVNFGSDLNLAQLAHGAGVLDEIYTEHSVAADTASERRDGRCLRHARRQRRGGKCPRSDRDHRRVGAVARS